MESLSSGPLLTLQAIAKRTGIPERTLRYHAEIGALVARRIGPRRLYATAAAVEAYAGVKISGNNGNADNLAVESFARAS